MTYSFTPPTTKDQFIGVVSFLLVAIITTGLRIQARRLRKAALEADDYWMLAGLVRGHILETSPGKMIMIILAVPNHLHVASGGL